MDKQHDKIMVKMNENVQELNNTVLFARKEIEKLKNDLTDILEIKHEAVL